MLRKISSTVFIHSFIRSFHNVCMIPQAFYTIYTNGSKSTSYPQVSGFVYVTSVLVSLEGKLKGDVLMDRDMLQLLHIVFYTISTAMRFEPANAKFFHHEVSSYSYYVCVSVRDG